MRDTKHILTIVIVMALISFMSLSLSVSYSYMTKVRTTKNVMNYTTKNMVSSISYTQRINNNITFMSDEEGLNQTVYSTISIPKPGYSTTYLLYFCYSTANTNFLPMEYVHFAVYDVVSNQLSAEPLVGPAIVADLPINGSSKTYSSACYRAYIGKVTSGTKKLAIKMWGGLEAEDNYDGRPINLSAFLTLYPSNYFASYTISGILKDQSSNPISGAIVSLGHGNFKATTSSTGAYSFTGVPVPQLYNVEALINGETYYTTLVFNYETTSYASGKITYYDEITTNNTAGTWLQTRAYARQGTVYGILRNPNNNLTNDSNSTASGAYYTPRSYVLYLADTITGTMSGINLNAYSDKTIRLTKAG